MQHLTNEQVGTYVTNLYHQFTQPSLLYHNINHTTYVVQKVEEIISNYSINYIDNFVLVTAAWFHDTGQLFSYGRNHEIKSVALMKEFFSQKEIEVAVVNKIEACILATQIPHQPRSLLEEIICDADTYNLGTKDFLRTDELLRKECELKEHEKNIHWDEDTLKFLEHHRYFTSYCQSVLNIGKQNNISVLRAKIEHGIN